MILCWWKWTCCTTIYEQLILKNTTFDVRVYYKLVELFKSTNKYTVNNLSMYVYEAFKFRLTNTVDINV